MIAPSLPRIGAKSHQIAIKLADLGSFPLEVNDLSAPVVAELAQDGPMSKTTRHDPSCSGFPDLDIKVGHAKISLDGSILK